MDKNLYETIKNKLSEEKKAVEDLLRDFAKKDPHPGEKANYDARFRKLDDNVRDKSDMADDVEEYENKLALEKELEKRLLAINSAVDRLEKNPENFDRCDNCKKSIPVEIIMANPSTTWCKHC